MKPNFAHFLLLACLTLVAGCCSAAPKPPQTDPAPYRPRWHGIVIVPGTNHPPVHFYNKLNPVWWFGNDAEPRAPDWYRPNRAFRNFYWHMRNPLVNFTSYVIGVADKKTVRYGRYPTLNGNPNSGWNFSATRRLIVFLPFIDYRRGDFEFYLGWRWRGNFGAKLNFDQERPRPGQGRPQTSEPNQGIFDPQLKTHSSPRRFIPPRRDSP